MNLATRAKVNKIIKESGVFVPKELTSSNVRLMIETCKVRPTTKNIFTRYIYNARAGFTEDKFKYEFDQDILNEQFENIIYMAGQLKDTRTNHGGALTLKKFLAHIKIQSGFQWIAYKVKETMYTI